MIPTDRLLPFLLTATIIIMAPGPQVVFVVGRALAYGKRTAVTTAMGGNFGAYLQGILVSLGLGTLVERSTLVFESIKLVGAAYLVFLGVKAFRHRRALSASMEASGESGTQRTVPSLRPYTSNLERTEALADFLHTYNYHRGHTAIAGQPPITRVHNAAGHYN
jgi:threonine/homoserine/homoserine lactone efflux protein